MLTKLAETLRVFARSRPSVGDLWRGRRREFDAADVVLPSRLVAGETATPTLQVWDEYERPLDGFEGRFDVRCTDPDATVPGSVRVGQTDEAVLALPDVTFETPGFQYVVLVGPDGERHVSNPVEVFASAPEYRLYWGDIHLHSQFSDGAGTVTSGMRFGRDVMDLDVVAYTDHDTMGFFIPPQLQRRRMHRRYFEHAKRVTEAFNDPGEFVTLFGYEWTKQPNRGGHVNVYFRNPGPAELFDSLDPDTNRYEKLWRRLREWRAETGEDVLTIPHHPAEAMYPFDFSAVDYDDELAPLVEVYSQWGNSELPADEGNPKPLGMGQGEVDERGHFVQDALALGHRVGMMGSSDFHAPRPGRSNIHHPPHLPSLSDLLADGVGWGHIWRVWNEQSYAGGLTGFYAPELTRDAVFDSLQARRVYATSQPHRIVVSFAVDGTRVGEDDSTVTLAAPDAERTVSYRVAGTAPLARVTVVKNNDPWQVQEVTDRADAGLDRFTLTGERTDDTPVTGLSYDGERGTDADVYYLRVEQVDGGMAWAGPVWVTVQ